MCFASFGLAQGALNATAVQTEEAALRAVVEKFYVAYGKKDLAGVMALWSEKSPDSATAKQALQQQFANEDYTFGSPVISRVRMEGEKVSLRVMVDFTAINLQNKQSRKGQMVRNFGLVKESGEWKVWRYVPAVDELAEALVKAKSEAERKASLAEEKELMTAELVRALNRQGNRFYNQGDYPQAIAVYRLGQSIAEQLGDKAGIASTLNNIGRVHYSQGNHTQALENYQQSLALSETLGDKNGVATTLNNIGNIHNAQGNYAKAMEHFQQSLTMREALGDQAGIASSLNNIGSAHARQANYGQALEYFQKSLTLRESLGDKNGVADTLGNIGLIHYWQGNYRQALNSFQKSLALSETIGNKAGIATTLGNIGLVHDSQGNHVEALASFQKSLTLSEDLGDQEGVASALGNIGSIYDSQGNYGQALDYYQKSLALNEALGDRAGIASMLNNMGLVYNEQGNYEQALEKYQQSLALSEAIGDRAGIARTRSNIGSVHYLQGNYLQALAAFQKSLTIEEGIGNKEGAAGSLGNIGNVHTSQGNYAQALEYFRKSLALGEELGNKALVARTWSNIGNIHYFQGNYGQAVGDLLKSLAMSEALGDRDGMASTWSSIGNAHLAQGHNAQALESYQKSLARKEALGDKAGIASALANIGNVHKEQGRYTQSLDLAERAVTLAQQIGSLDTLWQARLTAGAAYRYLKQPAQARQAFTEAIKTIETLRTQVAGGEQDTQRFFANKLSPYLAMADLLLTENNPAEALIYAERAKARALLDVLHSGRVNITKAMTEKEQEQERKLNNQLTSLNTQIYREKLRDQPDQTRLKDLEEQLQKQRLAYEAFETNLYAAHPELKVRRSETQMLTLEEARPLLPDARAAVLKFVVAEEKSSLFVLTKSASDSPAAVEVKVFPIAIKRKDLEERVAQFRNQVAERDQTFAKNAIALFQLLLAPAQLLLQGKTTLIIVPDGPLWELPFQALQSPENRYLLQDHAVFYAPSLTVLREMVKLRRQTRAPAANPTLLAVGNPALGQQTVRLVQDATMGEKLGPLPAAQRQAEELGKLYGQQRSKVYIGADATEERVKTESANYNILHLAAHGALNNRSPMYSHIVLSQVDENGKEDGLLEAWELMKLDLKADLAVLSACETARGRVAGGEGVIGLTWALFVAGCPTTVVSQWKVNDQSTADLMVEFHRRLRTRSASLDSRNSIAQALRQSALKLLGKSQYRHPYYWAGFIVVGDGY
jgi:tetratricopeptide (TPR) repeat protein